MEIIDNTCTDKVPFSDLKPGDWFKDSDGDLRMRIEADDEYRTIWPDGNDVCSIDDDDLVTPVDVVITINPKAK